MPRGLNALLAGGVLLAALLVHWPAALAQDGRVVSVYADGQTKTFQTDASNVGEALERAGVTVGEHDLIEPSSDTAINLDSFKINIYRARPVVIVDGDDRREVLSPYQSPRLIAEDAGLKTYPEDAFKLERINDILSEGSLGLKLTILRAAKLKLSLYGTVSTIRTQASTVEELLVERGLDPANGDLLRPAVDKKIIPDMTVYLIRISGDRVVKEEPIAYSVREIRDKSQPLGYEKIKSAGQNGSKLVTYAITYEDGREVSRRVLASVVVEQPIEQVVIVGDKYDLAEAFARLRQCEAGGAYDRNSGNGYYGAYQFDAGTWSSNAPSAWKSTLAHLAPGYIQDQAALNLYNARGWTPWPACSRSLGLL